jgi:hypothetical protein
MGVVFPVVGGLFAVGFYLALIYAQRGRAGVQATVDRLGIWLPITAITAIVIGEVASGADPFTTSAVLAALTAGLVVIVFAYLWRGHQLDATRLILGCLVIACLGVPLVVIGATR